MNTWNTHLILKIINSINTFIKILINNKCEKNKLFLFVVLILLIGLFVVFVIKPFGGNSGKTVNIFGIGQKLSVSGFSNVVNKSKFSFGAKMTTGPTEQPYGESSGPTDKPYYYDESSGPTYNPGNTRFTSYPSGKIQNANYYYYGMNDTNNNFEYTRISKIYNKSYASYPEQQGSRERIPITDPRIVMLILTGDYSVGIAIRQYTPIQKSEFDEFVENVTKDNNISENIISSINQKIESIGYSNITDTGILDIVRDSDTRLSKVSINDIPSIMDYHNGKVSVRDWQLQNLSRFYNGYKIETVEDAFKKTTKEILALHSVQVIYFIMVLEDGLKTYVENGGANDSFYAIFIMLLKICYNVDYKTGDAPVESVSITNFSVEINSNHSIPSSTINFIKNRRVKNIAFVFRGKEENNQNYSDTTKFTIKKDIPNYNEIGIVDNTWNNTLFSNTTVTVNYNISTTKGVITDYIINSAFFDDPENFNILIGQIPLDYMKENITINDISINISCPTGSTVNIDNFQIIVFY